MSNSLTKTSCNKEGTTIAVVGAGIVGSYLYNALKSNGFSGTIELIEISEQSNVKDINNVRELGGYKGISKGRRFGKYGTAIAWGGQINFITKADSLSGEGLVGHIQKHSSKVLRRIFGKVIINHSQNIKQGYWLWPWKRNIAKKFLGGKCIDKIARVKSIRLLENGSYSLETEEGKEIGVYQKVILTAGAFESAKILANSGLIERRLCFRDHISFKTHEIVDFRKSAYLRRIRPLLTSSGMITRRYVIPDGFVHFSFNERVLFLKF